MDICSTLGKMEICRTEIWVGQRGKTAYLWGKRSIKSNGDIGSYIELMVLSHV